MRTSTMHLVAALWLCVGVSAAGAQWLDYPTPDIPRTTDGKPDLTAAPPRAADGTPDLSGMWMIGDLGAMTNLTNTEMLPAARAVYEQHRDTYARDDPAVACLPEGPRGGINGLDPLRIVQTKNMTIVLHELGTYRIIHTDGRPLPKDMTPTWMGYSIGRWDGDTFVVTTAGYNDRTWLDFAGHPHSDALRLTERYRRPDFGHLQLEITYDDPKTYVTPFTVKLTGAFMADTDLIENVCLENERDRAKLVGSIADETRTNVTVPAATLVDYACTYDLPDLGRWTITASDNQLFVELEGNGGRQLLTPTQENVFVFPTIGGTVTFVRDARSNNAVTQLILTTVEGDIHAARR